MLSKRRAMAESERSARREARERERARDGNDGDRPRVDDDGASSGGDDTDDGGPGDDGPLNEIAQMMMGGGMPPEIAALLEGAASSGAAPIRRRAERQWRNVLYERAAAADGELCAICLEPCTTGQRVAAIRACGHEFHADCVRPWLSHNDRCPVCRTAVSDSGAAII